MEHVNNLLETVREHVRALVEQNAVTNTAYAAVAKSILGELDDVARRDGQLQGSLLNDVHWFYDELLCQNLVSDACPHHVTVTQLQLQEVSKLL